MRRILFVTKGNLSGPSFSLLHILPKIRREYEVSILLTSTGPFENVLKQQDYNVQVFSIRYRTIFFLYWLFKKERFDLIYLNGFSAPNWRVLIAAKLANCKTLWHIREILTVGPKTPSHLRKRVRFADHLIAVSEACADSIKTLNVKSSVTIIYNGIDLSEFQYEASEARQYLLRQLNLPDDSLILVTIGRIHWMKNQTDAIKAIGRVVKRYPQAHLCLLGDTDNEYLDQITSLITQLDLANNVHVLGFRDDILHILSGSDLCIHPTLAEAHPRALLEALAAGIPVVSYDVGGVKEALLDGETGYLVPVGDVEKLTSNIERLLVDPNLRYKLGQMGREIARRYFSIELSGDKVLKVINLVLQN